MHKIINIWIWSAATNSNRNKYNKRGGNQDEKFVGLFSNMAVVRHLSWSTKNIFFLFFIEYFFLYSLFYKNNFYKNIEAQIPGGGSFGGGSLKSGGLSEDLQYTLFFIRTSKFWFLTPKISPLLKSDKFYRI